MMNYRLPCAEKASHEEQIQRAKPSLARFLTKSGPIPQENTSVITFS